MVNDTLVCIAYGSVVVCLHSIEVITVPMSSLAAQPNLGKANKERARSV